MNNIDEVQIIYILKKNTNDEFKFPYQGSGKSLANEEFYSSSFDTINNFPTRTYLPKSFKDLSLRTFLKYLKSKFFK